MHPKSAKTLGVNLSLVLFCVMMLAENLKPSHLFSPNLLFSLAPVLNGFLVIVIVTVMVLVTVSMQRNLFPIPVSPPPRN
jgi:hypothetical protein